jgi:hypothetical protein
MDAYYTFELVGHFKFIIGHLYYTISYLSGVMCSSVVEPELISELDHFFFITNIEGGDLGIGKTLI